MRPKQASSQLTYALLDFKKMSRNGWLKKKSMLCRAIVVVSSATVEMGARKGRYCDVRSCGNLSIWRNMRRGKKGIIIIIGIIRIIGIINIIGNIGIIGDACIIGISRIIGIICIVCIINFGHN